MSQGGSIEGTLPLRKSDQRWGPLAVFGNTASAAIATWCFITGGFVAYYLPAGPGALALTGGTLIGVFLALLAALPMATRYGVEAVRSTRPTLGSRGSHVTLVLVLIILVGWNSVLTIFLAQAATEALVTMKLMDRGTGAIITPIFAVVACVAVVILLRRGTGVLRYAGPIVAITVLVLAAVIIAILLTQFGFAHIMAAPALDKHAGGHVNLMIVVELGIAGALAWWPYVGSLTRSSRSTRGAILPSILGLGALMSVVLVIGLFAAVVVPDSGGNPTKFMIGVGGPLFGVVALLFMVMANIGTIMVGAYASALALKQSPAVDRKISWLWAVVISVVPVVLVSTFLAEPFMAYYGTFLAFAGVTLGPICGVQIADYYFIRRQELNVRSLYSEDGRGAYWYFAGFNPVGFVAVAAGIVTYLLVLDPVSFTAGPGFEIATASLPATFVAGLVYYIGARVTPRVWGGRTRRDLPVEQPVRVPTV